LGAPFGAPLFSLPTSTRPAPAQRVLETNGIIGAIPIGKRLTIGFGLTKSALIVANHAIMRRKGSDLRIEHRVIHEESVA